tara:strand:+ start:352 stop:1497 length:1146 start_codon:yes stop_codon:yes gene_type:complete
MKDIKLIYLTPKTEEKSLLRSCLDYLNENHSNPSSSGYKCYYRFNDKIEELPKKALLFLLCHHTIGYLLVKGIESFGDRFIGLSIQSCCFNQDSMKSLSRLLSHCSRLERFDFIGNRLELQAPFYNQEFQKEIIKKAHCHQLMIKELTHYQTLRFISIQGLIFTEDTIPSLVNLANQNRQLIEFHFFGNTLYAQHYSDVEEFLSQFMTQFLSCDQLKIFRLTECTVDIKGSRTRWTDHLDRPSHSKIIQRLFVELKDLSNVQLGQVLVRTKYLKQSILNGLFHRPFPGGLPSTPQMFNDPIYSWMESLPNLKLAFKKLYLMRGVLKFIESEKPIKSPLFELPIDLAVRISEDISLLEQATVPPPISMIQTLSDPRLQTSSN